MSESGLILLATYFISTALKRHTIKQSLGHAHVRSISPVTKGMRDSDANSANLVLTGVQAAVLTAPLIWDIPLLDMGALTWFALSDVCASFTG